MIYIDFIIIGVFLVITFATGLYYGKGVKTFQAYAVGNRKMSNWVITISLIATTYGGSILVSRLYAYYRQSLYMFITDLVSPINFFLTSRCIIPRMKEFMGHFSVAESMGSIYGPMVRVITAILGIIMSIALLAFQFKVSLAIVTTLYPEVEQFLHYLTIILVLLVISYSTFGGVRAVALTSVYQFFIFGICCSIIVGMVLYHTHNPLDGWQGLVAMFPFNLEKVLTWNDILAAKLVYFIWRSVFPFDPARIQRFYMASSMQQATKVFHSSAMIRVLCSILFLSVVAAVYFGGHSMQSGQNALINYITNLVYFPGMKGVLVTAIIALLMSTAGSNLHAASVLLANDIWIVLTHATKQVNTPSLKMVRIASVLIGITSLFVVLHISNIAQLLNKAVCFYSLAVTIPLILSSFGFRPRSAAVLLTMGINITIIAYRTYYIRQTLSQQNIFELLVINILTLVVTHYLLPKHPNTGWVGIKDRSLLDLQNPETKRWWLRCLQKFKTLSTKQYWGNLFPRNATTFILSGIYLIISTSIALWFMQKKYFFPYIYWYISVMTIGTMLVIYPALHSYKEGGNVILHGIWPVLLFMLLFFSTIQFAKLGNFRPMVCALVAANLGLSIVLLSLKIGLSMLGLAMLMHQFTPPNVPFKNFFLVNYQEIDVELIFAITIGVATLTSFNIYKYLCDKAKIRLNVMELARAYERRSALEFIYSQVNWSRFDPTYGSDMLQTIGEVLQAPCQYLYTKGQQKLGADVNRCIKKLSEFSSLLLKNAKTARSLGLNKRSVKFVKVSPIILNVHRTIRALGVPIQLLLRNQTEVKQLLTDPSLFERFLTINLLATSSNHRATDHMLTLTITDTMLRYGYINSSQTSNAVTVLPALAFFISTDTGTQSVLPVYDVTDEITPVFLPKTEKEFYKAESEQIVKSHGGYVKVIETKTTLTYLYILPVAGEQVMYFKA